MNNMKKKLSVLLAIVIVLTSLIIPVSADTAGSTPDGAYINTGGTLYPVTKGDTYTYEYRLNLGKKLTAIDASLSYDTAGLELVNYTFPILGSSANAGTYGGKLYFNYASATGIEFSGSSAVLIRATFKVKAENGTFDVHTDHVRRYQEVKIVANGTVISSFSHDELITDDDSKTSIYIKTGNKYYKVKRGKTYNYICYLKTDERVGNLEATTKYSSDGLSTEKSSSYYNYSYRSVKTVYQSYSGKSFAEDNTVLVSIPFTVSEYAYDNSTYSITTSISKLLDINEDTISRYTVTEVIEGLSYTMYDPNAPTEAPTEASTTAPTEAPTEAPSLPSTAIRYNHADGIFYNVSTDTPTCEEAIEACGGIIGKDTQTVYFQLPAEDPVDDNKNWTNRYNILPGTDYAAVCVYWWGKGVGTTWPDKLTDGKNVAQVWVGYRATLIDPANRIYRAVVPNDGGTACIVWNNGVNAGMDYNAPIFKYGRQLQDIDIEGGEEGDNFCYDNLPEGTPDPDSCDGCITVANWSRSTPNYFTQIPVYGADWYIYYGDGCYGKYAKTSRYFTSVEENCVNPEHHHFDEPTEPAPEPTEPVPEPTEPAPMFRYDADDVSFDWYGTDINVEFHINSSFNYNMSDLEAMYIDGYYVDPSYISENKIDRDNTTIILSRNYVLDLTYGEHNVHFDFARGSADCILTYPEVPQSATVLRFDANSIGWTGMRAVQFYVYDPETRAELLPWGSKMLNGTDKDGDNIWEYDLAANGMDVIDGKQYAIIFVNSDTREQTYDLLFDTSCYGDIAYCTGNRIENPYDSNKSAMEARWRNSNMGPMLQITSIGNVVGETIPSNTSAYQMIVDFLASKGKDGLSNALNFNGKDAQTTIDDIATKLGLTKEDVIKAIDDAKTIGNSYTGDRTDWSSSWDASRSTLPGGSSEPTEPPTDSYGYIPGEYYLTGSINGDNSGTANVHKGLRFKDYSSDSMILEEVRLTQGDVVRVARYNGNNTFTVYPDGVGRDISITQSGRYNFYFKPYELGNGNYWYITPSYLGEVAPFLLGDADGNESIETADVTFIQRWLAKIDTPYTKAELMRGDVDDSGDLELTDVTWLQYYLTDIQTPYQIGKQI